MKRLFTAAAILLACAGAWAQGIGSAKDLQVFIEACNKGESLLPWCNADSVVVLTADIDLGKAKKLPQVTSFDAVFDGQGHRLKNWKAQGGLFKKVGRKGIVHGIVIDASCTMKVTSKGEESHYGFITDYNDGTIYDCFNYGAITHKCDYALSPIYIGGIAGYNRYVIHDCRNEGAISSDVSGLPKEDVFVCVGGICGGARGKAPIESVIAHCENTAKVSVIGNLISLFAGGIAGYPNKTSVKYCINRGQIVANILETEEGKTNGIARAGGIAGQTKEDIARCKNYGPVTTMGACGGNVGGIVGMPHDILSIVDCVNFGAVTAEGENTSNAGGIAGNIGRPVHIRGCTNYGKVAFEGISSRTRSTAAGIVGNIYTVKDATQGAYVRECINHGEIHAGSGGNKYDSSNRNAIHAAGVVGYADSRPELRAFVVNCSNDGKVSCSSGRKGDVIASAVAVKTGGEASKAIAKPVDKPKPDGSTIWGGVSTPDGKPLEGIVVTDGIQCVKTDAQGKFSFKSDMAQTRFVYLSLPATVAIPTRNGVPQFFLRIPADTKAAEANFVLETKAPEKDYTIMMIADPQVRPYGWDNSMERWGDTVASDAEAFRASCTGPVYSINLGDLVYNEMDAWDDYMDIAATIKCPTFNVIGNHDYDQGTLFETEQGNMYYETYVGPTRYSFDLGDIHYIVMNDILYDRKDASDKYHYGLDNNTLAWLKEDLKFVPKDKIIVTCTHHNPFKTPNTSPHGSHNVYSLHYQEYLELLSSYKEVYAWNGHNHENFYYDYLGKKTTHGAPNIQCISVARATGALRFNVPIGAKGEPQGYMVLNVHGENMDWYYKGVGTGKDYQMRAYSPARTEDGTVMVNIWNWSEGWTTPAWYENGVKVADMEFTPRIDPDYYDLFAKYDNAVNKRYCTPSDKSIIFTVTPTDGATSGEIRVTDLFGNTYTQTVSW